MQAPNHKPVSLDDLVIMVAGGFNDLGERIEKVEGRLEKLDVRMEKLEGRMDGLDGRMDKLEGTMTALNSSVNRYLDISDERYLELKNRDKFLAGWLKVIADKTGVPIDLNQLEKI